MAIELTQEEIDRFNSNWTKIGDCHIWHGHKDQDGYGVIGMRRAKRRAARVAMLIAGRPLPLNLVANHTCRNPACVNPQHINGLTPAQNSMQDSNGIGYINSKKTHCPKGHGYDRIYGGQRYCSTCEADKSKRLREKWKAEGIERI